MSTSEYYRREARRCRDLASASTDDDAAARWRAIAADYEKLAEAMDAPVIPHAQVQRQPMQQQQQKKSGEEPQ